MRTTERSFRNNVSARHSLRALWRYARPHRAVLGLTLLLTLLTSSVGLVQPLVAREALDALDAGTGLGALVALMVVLMLVAGGISGYTTWLQRRTAERIVRQVRGLLSRRLLRLRVAELDRRSPADLVSRVTADSTLLQNAVTQGFVMLVNGILTLVGACVLMAMVQPVLFAATVTVLGAVAGALRWVLPRIRHTVTRTQVAVGEIGARLDRPLGALRTVKSNGAEPRETAAVDTAIESAYRSGLAAGRYHAAIGVLTTTGMQGAFLVVLGVGGVLVTSGRIGVSTLIAFLLYVFYLSAPIASLTGGLTHLQQGLGAIVRIREVEAMAVEPDVDLSSPDEAAVPGQAAPEVVARQLTFSYAGRTPALRDVTFRVAPGTRTALVGLSGAGKSTMFALMQRFYEPSHGVIEVGGRDIVGMSRVEVRRMMAYVEQDAPVMAGTIRENLLYGRPQAAERDVAAAVRDSGLTDLVNGLEDGLDTAVGSRGVLLSGGERQRLAIARALVRRPRVLLLDEVTANLDARNERALREVVDRISPACTVILIAHRLSTVTSADQIVVFERGTVRAVGTHASLLGTDSLYRDLVTTQLIAEPGPTRVAG